MLIRPYRWYGGKLRMAHTIQLLMPVHTAYYEPFMGSASLLLNHPRSKLEVINDLDPDLACLMRTLADEEKGKELVERLGKLWYGKFVFDEAMECKKRHFGGMDDIEKSVAIYVLITQSFNATRQNFSAKAYRDTGAYRSDIRFNLPLVHERLKDVKVLNMDGIDVIERAANKPDAFVMADPPYRHELRGRGADKAYACELPHSQQIRLLKILRTAKCKVLLCGYKTDGKPDLYDTYLLPCGWHCYKLTDIVKSCQTKKIKDVASEYIWVNYTLPEEAKYVISLHEHRTI